MQKQHAQQPLSAAVQASGDLRKQTVLDHWQSDLAFLPDAGESLARPGYAGGGSGSILIASGANAFYDGMVASIQHRLSANFSFLANYTWSHFIDIQDNPGDIAGTTVQNPANIEGDRSNCGFDFRNILNSTMVASSNFSLTGWKAGYSRSVALCMNVAAIQTGEKVTFDDKTEQVMVGGEPYAG